jgi:hypothetical protein
MPATFSAMSVTAAFDASATAASMKPFTSDPVKSSTPFLVALFFAARARRRPFPADERVPRRAVPSPASVAVVDVCIGVSSTA